MRPILIIPPQYELTANHVLRFVPMPVASEFSSWIFVKLEDMFLADCGKTQLTQ
jgi:hypothetical protein